MNAIIKRPEPIVQPPAIVTLNLTEREAFLLKEMTGNMSGRDAAKFFNPVQKMDMVKAGNFVYEIYTVLNRLSLKP